MSTASAYPRYPRPSAYARIGSVPPTGVPGAFGAQASDSLLALAIMIIFFSVSYLQRIGLVVIPSDNIFDSQQIPCSFMFGYLAIFILWVANRIWIDWTRVMFFLPAFACAIATCIIDTKAFSLFSMLDFIALYAPFMLVVPVREETYRWALRLFNKLMVGVAVIALIQVLASLKFYQYSDPLPDIVPERFLMLGYNVDAMVDYDTQFQRANAVFFLEPSFVSQFLAVAIMVEILYFKRWWRCALYGAGMLASLSGTGFLLLAFFFALYMIKQKQWLVLLLFGMAYLATKLVPDDTVVGHFLGRSNEIQSQDSSAYIRFVSPFLALQELNTFVKFVFGFGPGRAKTIQMPGHIPMNPFPFAKMMLEYGILGTIPFFAFITHAFFSQCWNKLLAVSLFFMYNLLSGSLLQPHTIFLMWIFVALLVPLQEGNPVNAGISPSKNRLEGKGVPV